LPKYRAGPQTQRILMKPVLVIAVTCFLYILGIVFFLPTKPMTPDKIPGSTLKIIADTNSHGSGTHIGSGYIITANHVLMDKKSISVKTDDGKVVTGTVLWTSPEYDIALVRAETLSAQTSKINCAPLVTGLDVEARGNPTAEEFVSSFGKVSAKSTAPQIEVNWKTAWMVSMTVVPGMSGGGVFNRRNELVGVSVGVMVVGSMMSQSMVGFGYIVPASAVCNLLPSTERPVVY
jgi:S1-C subfamily serine protease